MTEKSKKREIPSALQTLLTLDVKVTNQICNWANNFLPSRSFRKHYVALEWSCHGLIWFTGLIALIWLLDSPSLFQMQVNLFLGLLLDIIFVGLLKAITRRRRPPTNKSSVFEVGPDKFSFPSGHASRAYFVAYFFMYLWPLPFFFLMPLMAWASSVAVSRLLLRRHHLLDVMAGSLLGVFEGVLVGWLWLSQQNSEWFVSVLSDEKMDGGSYHV